ncbi:unnamed protein product [Caenorhabditis auriculariae]|uniref:PDZ domain-containing protein n=1 Tax=Caenorhabditis auriculariae TaxID=2777116 RepID=A0A8S1HWN8_9PELO|nr:unnamed protein product [Caenorhabditis auriculariae]
MTFPNQQRFQRRGCFRSRSRSRDAARRSLAAPVGQQPRALEIVPWSSVTIEEISSEHVNAPAELAKMESVSEEVHVEDNKALVASQEISNPLAQAAVDLKFACQMAHGSPVAVIQRWSTIEELYSSMAEAFDVPKSELMFLTVNTFKVDMTKLFTGTLNFTDMLYAHVRGQPVEVELIKDETSFGVTITDNGMGNAFVKAIRDGSVFARAFPATRVGQLIEKIDGVNVLGKRHYEVARIFRSIPIGTKVNMRLISPQQSPLEQFISRRAPGAPKKNMMESLKKGGTIRFKSNGSFVVEDKAPETAIIEKLNDVFDSYLGVQDDQLAARVWETAAKCSTLWELNEAIQNSDLNVFEFPDGLVFDMWGIISDLKRVKKATPAPFREAQPQR